MTSYESPSPTTIDALLAGHALGDLDEREREQLAVLLREQPELRQRLDEFSTTLELLPLALPATAMPPPQLRRRLMEPQRVPPPALFWLIPALLGLGLLILGRELQQTREQLAELRLSLPAPQSLPAVSRRLILEAKGPGNQASGEVMVTGNATNNVLMLNDLPPLPPHQTYRLWAEVDGHKVGCVSFTPTVQGHVAMMIPPMPTSLARQVSVTVETDPLGAAPHGPEVLSSSI